MVTHYDILKVTPNASLVVIRAAHNALCKKYNPENYQDETKRAKAQAVIKRLNVAYAVLSDIEKRKLYDESIGISEKVVEEITLASDFQLAENQATLQIQKIKDIFNQIDFEKIKSDAMQSAENVKDKMDKAINEKIISKIDLDKAKENITHSVENLKTLKTELENSANANVEKIKTEFQHTVEEIKTEIEKSKNAVHETKAEPKIELPKTENTTSQVNEKTKSYNAYVWSGILIILMLIFGNKYYEIVRAEKIQEQQSKIIEAKNRENQRREEKEAEENDGYHYTAFITCTNYGVVISTDMCFRGHDVNTELELTNGDEYFMLQGYEIANMGETTQEGLVIPLKKHFQIKVQNASEFLKLTVSIKDNKTKKRIFIKSAAQFRVISITN